MSNLIKRAVHDAGLKVIDYELDFVNPLKKSNLKIDHIIIHHDIWEGGTMKRIHYDHINNRGWSGVGYHARVRTDGTIELGRPYGMVAAHCKEQKMNHRSIGIVFEGNFDVKMMKELQFEAGSKFIAEIIRITGISIQNIKGHREYALYKTCPGKVFPLDSLKNRVGNALTGNSEVSNFAKEAYLFVKSEGISDGSRPKDTVTREEVWTMIHRMAKR